MNVYSPLRILVITLAFVFCVPSVQAGEVYSLEQIKRHLSALYYDQERTVIFRVEDTYAYVYGLNMAEFQLVQDVAATIERQTQQKIFVLNEQQDFPPGIEKHASMIMFLDHMTDQVLASPYHDEFTSTGWPFDEYAKHVADLKRTRGLMLSKFVRDPSETSDHTFRQVTIFVEKDTKRLGYNISFRRYAAEVLVQALTGAGSSNVISPSIFNSTDTRDDFGPLPPIDAAYIKALYAHDNWAELTNAQAIDQLTRTMMNDLSATP